MSATWDDLSMGDTGNGAIKYRHTSQEWPGVEKHVFSSYCGREKDRTWYEAVGDDQRLEFSTPAKAAERYRECVRLRDQSEKIKSLEAQLAARR